MRLLVVFLSLLHFTHSYNFLVFCPLFGHSHTTFFSKIADILTDSGHNVTLFTPTIVEKFRNMSYARTTKDVVHLAPSKKLKEYGDMLESNDVQRFWTEDSSATEILPVIQLFQDMYNELANVMRENLNVLDDLKKRNFDVIIFESYVFSAYPLMDYLEIKTFIPSLSITHDIWLSRSIGEPVMPSVVSNVCSPFGDEMTLLERAFNAISTPFFDLFLGYPTHRSFRAPYDIIDIPTLEPEASFVFINSNPFVDFPRPILTKTVEIGGVSVDLEELRSQQVDDNWSKVLDMREKTMLVSFGSVMFSKGMPLEHKKSLAGVMKSFQEVTFIWKYEDTDTQFAEGVDNIHFSKWVPQTALLADSRLSAFMTHGGLGSINEVSYLGKPSILCPLFVDQMRNAKMLARHNGSIEISKFDLTDIEKMESAFRKILYDQSYTENSQKLAAQLENQPIKPREMIVKYAEFAARFGRLPSLDPYSRKMSFVEYFLIDVAVICSLITVFVLWLLKKSCELCISGVCIKKSKVE